MALGMLSKRCRKSMVQTVTGNNESNTKTTVAAATATALTAAARDDDRLGREK